MPNHSSASLIKFYRPEFQAQMAMNIIREYLGYLIVGEFVVSISVNKFPLQGLFRHAWMHVSITDIKRIMSVACYASPSPLRAQWY
jgi:hypothetical protein